MFCKRPKETIFSIMKWHEETFPDCTLDGQLEKYQEEQREWVESGNNDISELADMFIVACGIARFDLWEGLVALSDVYDWYEETVDLDFKDLMKAVNKKMAINRKRKWGKQGGLYKHIEK